MQVLTALSQADAADPGGEGGREGVSGLCLMGGNGHP